MKFLTLLAVGLSYVPPSSVLLRQMAVERSAQLPGNFTVAGTLTVFGEEGRKLASAAGLSPPSSGEPLTVAALLDLGAGRCTLELTGTKGVPQKTSNDRGTLTPPGGGPSAWLVRLGCQPFLFRGEGGEASLEALMRKAGGRFEEPALTLLDGEVAYVFGAGESGAGKVGLVVKKRGLTPLRTWEEEAGIRVTVDFRGYRQSFHDGGFPSAMELRTAGGLIATFAATP